MTANDSATANFISPYLLCPCRTYEEALCAISAHEQGGTNSKASSSRASISDVDSATRDRALAHQDEEQS